MTPPEKYPPVSFRAALAHFGPQKGFRIVSGELHGPCPDCGGDDRFRVTEKPNGEAGFFCRQCGGPSKETRLALLDAARGNGIVDFPAPAPRPAPQPKTDARGLRKLWRSGVAIPGAAAAPLDPCNLWADGFGAAPAPWPDTLRWVPGAPVGWQCCGRIVARYDCGAAECVALQSIPVHVDGRRGAAWGKDEQARARRKYPLESGSRMRGAACLLFDPPGARLCFFTEGIKDGLAAAALLAAGGLRARVAAIGSARPDADAALFAADGLPVSIGFDNDDPGAAAARRLADMLARMRMQPCSICLPPPGFNDWANLLEASGDNTEKSNYLKRYA